jgi:hypothetical protein
VESCAVPDLQQCLRDGDIVTKLLHQNLTRQQQHMKSRADKKRSEHHFELGDLVYLKLQPYVQKSLTDQGKRKLAFRYYGPSQVLQKVGKVAYKLELPATSQIHHVIHMSQLKKAVGVATPVCSELPLVELGSPKPDMILGTQGRPFAEAREGQVFVRWQGLPDAMATWENRAEL